MLVFILQRTTTLFREPTPCPSYPPGRLKVDSQSVVGQSSPLGRPRGCTFPCEDVETISAPLLQSSLYLSSFFVMILVLVLFDMSGGYINCLSP